MWMAVDHAQGCGYLNINMFVSSTVYRNKRIGESSERQPMLSPIPGSLI
jgi:hypothetical protein